MKRPVKKRILGAFEIVKDLAAKGAQGKLYVGRALEPCFDGLAAGDLVALKVMEVHDDDGERAFRRLKRRTDALVAAAHPGVVRYYGCFDASDESKDQHVIVMELLSGQTLEERLGGNRLGIDADYALRIITICADALVHVAEYGLVHRDIKPSNIFLCEDGGVKLIDFEIARQEGASRTTTESGAMRGTVDYMAPDFHPDFRPDKGFHGDECSDVFSLTVCLYEMLAGSRPYAVGGMMGEQSMMAYFQRWTKVAGADVSKSLKIESYKIHALAHVQKVIKKGLSPERAGRYQSYHEFSEALRQVKVREVASPKARYELLRCVGKGGFGVVFRARRKSDGLVVAIKVLLRAEYSERFTREAKALAKFRDDRLVSFVEYFSIVRNTAETYFIVMQFLDGMPGSSLRDRIVAANARGRGAGRIGLREILVAFRRYAGGLKVLHDGGIIHRDIKPANLYMPDGAPERSCVMDLGVVKTDETQTNGSLPGTLDYMPPEMALGQSRGSPAVDIYALGLCLHEALTGEPLFPRLKRGGDGLAEFYRRAKEAKPPDLSRLDSLPTWQSIVRNMTAHDVARRIGDCAIVISLLDAVPASELADPEQPPDDEDLDDDTFVIPNPRPPRRIGEEAGIRFDQGSRSASDFQGSDEETDPGDDLAAQVPDHGEKAGADSTGRREPESGRGDSGRPEPEQPEPPGRKPAPEPAREDGGETLPAPEAGGTAVISMADATKAAGQTVAAAGETNATNATFATSAAKLAGGDLSRTVATRAVAGSAPVRIELPGIAKARRRVVRPAKQPPPAPAASAPTPTPAASAPAQPQPSGNHKPPAPTRDSAARIEPTKPVVKVHGDGAGPWKTLLVAAGLAFLCAAAVIAYMASQEGEGGKVNPVRRYFVAHGWIDDPNALAYAPGPKQSPLPPIETNTPPILPPPPAPPPGMVEPGPTPGERIAAATGKGQIETSQAPEDFGRFADQARKDVEAATDTARTANVPADWILTKSNEFANVEENFRRSIADRREALDHEERVAAIQKATKELEESAGEVVNALKGMLPQIGGSETPGNFQKGIEEAGDKFERAARSAQEQGVSAETIVRLRNGVDEAAGNARKAIGTRQTEIQRAIEDKEIGEAADAFANAVDRAVSDLKSRKADIDRSDNPETFGHFATDAGKDVDSAVAKARSAKVAEDVIAFRHGEFGKAAEEFNGWIRDRKGRLEAERIAGEVRKATEEFEKSAGEAVAALGKMLPAIEASESPDIFKTEVDRQSSSFDRASSVARGKNVDAVKIGAQRKKVDEAVKAARGAISKRQEDIDRQKRIAAAKRDAAVEDVRKIEALRDGDSNTLTQTSEWDRGRYSEFAAKIDMDAEAARKAAAAKTGYGDLDKRLQKAVDDFADLRRRFYAIHPVLLLSNPMDVPVTYYVNGIGNEVPPNGSREVNLKPCEDAKVTAKVSGMSSADYSETSERIVQMPGSGRVPFSDTPEFRGNPTVIVRNRNDVAITLSVDGGAGREVAAGNSIAIEGPPRSRCTIAYSAPENYEISGGIRAEATFGNAGTATDIFAPRLTLLPRRVRMVNPLAESVVWTVSAGERRFKLDATPLEFDLPDGVDAVSISADPPDEELESEYRPITESVRGLRRSRVATPLRFMAEQDMDAVERNRHRRQEKLEKEYASLRRRIKYAWPSDPSKTEQVADWMSVAEAVAKAMDARFDGMRNPDEVADWLRRFEDCHPESLQDKHGRRRDLEERLRIIRGR